MFHIYFELAVSLSFNFIGFPKFKHPSYCHAKKNLAMQYFVIYECNDRN